LINRKPSIEKTLKVRIEARPKVQKVSKQYSQQNTNLIFYQVMMMKEKKNIVGPMFCQRQQTESRYPAAKVLIL
jgi:hypothetical protein